ncbi:hypothetical protein AMJ57_02545 [Parcubacteria bacterium SG8_24]|nr:MAG: hypothetical protein AMJ57_02545 [Parcubacteria bacterium SG8_24]
MKTLAFVLVLTLCITFVPRSAAAEYDAGLGLTPEFWLATMGTALGVLVVLVVASSSESGSRMSWNPRSKQGTFVSTSMQGPWNGNDYRYRSPVLRGLQTLTP